MIYFYYLYKLSKQKTDYQNIDLLTSEFDKISTNNYNNNKPSNQKIQDQENLVLKSLKFQVNDQMFIYM